MRDRIRLMAYFFLYGYILIIIKEINMSNNLWYFEDVNLFKILCQHKFSEFKKDHNRLENLFLV